MQRQAGALIEIEITPAMIEAGASVLRLAALGPETCCGEQELACDVLRAMLQPLGEFQILES